MKSITRIAGLALALSGTGAIAAAPDTNAVEFFNTFTGHYFVTASASEARLVDQGSAGPGWVRTGRSFQAWLDKSSAAAGAQPVCRFYSTGANSHFYTASASECAGLQQQAAAERAATGTVRGWQYEGTAFYVQVPTNGTCPAGTVQITRAYNNGFATGEGSNHRFIDDPELQSLMADSKWIAEGTAFCAPANPATGTEAALQATTTAFDAVTGAWKGDAKWELDNAGQETEATHALELDVAADGSVSGQGNGCTFTGQLAQGDGFRSLFAGKVSASGCTDAGFNGDYARLRLQRFGADTVMAQMVKADGTSEASIHARLVNASATSSTPPPADFSGVAGEWVGNLGFEAHAAGDAGSEGNRAADIVISSSGGVSGTAFGCTVSGTLALPAHGNGPLTGSITTTGCDVAALDGTYTQVSVEALGQGRLRVGLHLQAQGHEVEIEGMLVAKGTTSAPPPSPSATLAGTYDGMLAWSVAGASGAGSAHFVIGSDGTLTGTGAGCTFSGTLQLAFGEHAASGGSVTASGCTNSALNRTYSGVEVSTEDGGALVVQLESKDASGEAHIRAFLRRTS